MKWKYTNKEWRTYVANAWLMLLKGLAMIVWSVVIAVTSFFCRLGGKIRKAYIDHPKAFLITMIVMILVGWIATYAGMKAKLNNTQNECDTLSLRIDSMRTADPKVNTYTRFTYR